MRCPAMQGLDVLRGDAAEVMGMVIGDDGHSPDSVAQAFFHYGVVILTDDISSHRTKDCDCEGRP